MATNKKTTRAWPVVDVRLDEDGTAHVSRLGTVHPISAADRDAAWEQARGWIAAEVAAELDPPRPVAVTVDAPDGLWHVQVDPQGVAVPSDHGQDRRRRRPRTSPAPEQPRDDRHHERTADDHEEPPAISPQRDEDAEAASPTEEPRPAPAPADRSVAPAAADTTSDPLEDTKTVPDPAPVPSTPAGSGTPIAHPSSPVGAHRQERPSFITAGRTVQPAQEGWRGTLNRFGLRLAPGPEELSMRQDVEAVSQHWGGPRTIAVVNGKGSASKTPTTACLAAVFARYGGAGALAWDNNETRGSLAWRTEGSAHKATVLDMLPRADALMAPTAQYAEMANYVHHQPADKYDVLWSDQSVSGDHIVTAEDVHQVHQVAARYYRLIVMDSGNSERAPNWRAMVEHADRIVVPCTNVEDTAEAGARLIEALGTRGSRQAQLAADAVVIVSQRTPGKDPNLDRIVAGYRDMGMTVVTIPYDPALQTGVIRWDSFRPATQRAWLRAAAEVAQGL